MLPLRDHNPSRQTPYVTYALMAVNITVFLLSWEAFQTPGIARQLYADWAMVPAFVNEFGAYHSLFTSMFLHGGLMHLAGNMLFLWIFGDNLEEQLGHVRFLLFYLFVGVVSAYVHLWANPESVIPLVGASGAIAGVMGGYLLLFPKARIDILLILVVFFRVFTVPAWLMLGVWFALQLFGIATTDITAGGIAYDVHFGGFVAGILAIWPLWLRRGGPAFWHKNHGHPPHPQTQYRWTKTRIPRIGVPK
ncbi:MAG: rhomboid family intramembrane serine protease [Rhodobacterales bacterium]|nr:MAG: rhomboid family intramembrane serine protease [Rhodobacterales bacterium]